MSAFLRLRSVRQWSEHPPFHKEAVENVEVLIDRPEWERIVLPYKPSLERLGIAMTLRTVDDAQYENRLRQWDYEQVILQKPSMSHSTVSRCHRYWKTSAHTTSSSV